MKINPPNDQFQHDGPSAVILCTEFDVKANHSMAELAKASRQATASTKNLNHNLIPVGNGTLSGMTECSL